APRRAPRKSAPAWPPAETVWVEPYPDETMGVEDGLASPDARFERRESLELAFVAALQLLPATQRAVLILREVLGYSAKEVAATLGTTVASVNSALQRARKTIDDKLPERSQQETLRALGDEQLTQIVDAYMDALQRGDVPRVVSMLAEDAAWSMPPLPTWFGGHDGITDFLRNAPLSGQRRRPTCAATGRCRARGAGAPSPRAETARSRSPPTLGATKSPRTCRSPSTCSRS